MELIGTDFLAAGGIHPLPTQSMGTITGAPRSDGDDTKSVGG